MLITQYQPLAQPWGMVSAGAWMESIQVCLFSNLIQLVEIGGLKELSHAILKNIDISIASIRNMS